MHKLIGPQKKRGDWFESKLYYSIPSPVLSSHGGTICDPQEAPLRPLIDAQG